MSERSEIRLTASVVCYGTDAGELSRCLAMLGAAGAERVYVVDNGSAVAPVEGVCRASDAPVEYLPGANVGYGAGHNRALRLATEAGARYHLVVNSDLEFGADDVRRLLAYLDEHDDVALVHPRVVNPDGSDQLTVRMLPTPFDLVLRRFLPSWVMRGRRRRYLLADFDHGRELNVPYVQGSFMLLRLGALTGRDGVGLFDERFFMYPEDIDLTRRLHERYRTMYVPTARVVHYHRASSYRSWRMLWVHVVNMCRYFGKWGWLVDRGRREANRRLRRAVEQSVVN